MKDGKNISSYTIIPEYRSKLGDITIGIFCHDFGLILLSSSVKFYNGKAQVLELKMQNLLKIL